MGLEVQTSRDLLSYHPCALECNGRTVQLVLSWWRRVKVAVNVGTFGAGGSMKNVIKTAAGIMINTSHTCLAST